MSVVDRTSSEFGALLDLYERAPLLELGQLADAERWRQHPENVVTYIIDRNINYTNVCVADCGFCAFYRRPKDSEGYVISFEEIGAAAMLSRAVAGVYRGRLVFSMPGSTNAVKLAMDRLIIPELEHLAWELIR